APPRKRSWAACRLGPVIVPLVACLAPPRLAADTGRGCGAPSPEAGRSPLPDTATVNGLTGRCRPRRSGRMAPPPARRSSLPVLEHDRPPEIHGITTDGNPGV